MHTRILIALLLLASPASAQYGSKPVVGGGFSTIDWIFAMKDRDLFDAWAQHGPVGKLQGPVATYLDWPNVSSVLVLYNGWHLRGVPKDDRIQHIEDNLTRAAFGDRFKGKNPGGDYILLLRYKNSDRAVVVGFKDGVFLIEGIEGIGAVDVRGPPRPPAAPRSR